MKKTHGDEEARARDLFYALWIPDLFMKRVIEEKEWTLFSPEEVIDLHDLHGSKFEEAYERYESLIDQGKKDLGEGIVVAYSVVENKVGIAVGITSALTKKYNAVELVKLGSKLIGGTGGGGRPDFAQSGGNQIDSIEKSFEAIKKSIK